MLDVRSEIETAISSSSDGSQPSTETPTAGTDASATPAITEPATQSTSTPIADDDESVLQGAGAIPVDRVRKIIQNTRTKATTEAEGRYAWAKDLKPETYQEQRQILSWLDSDPVGFHKFLDGQLKSNPDYASHFATAEPKQADPEPQPDLELGDGTMTYSRSQFNKLFEWRERQLENRFSERFGPIEQAFKEQAATHAGLGKAQAVLADARTWTGFTDNMVEIRQLMETDKRVTLESAYRRVVVPKLQQQDKDRRDALRKELLEELKNRPAANTEVPGRANTSAPASYKGRSTDDVMRSVLAEMGG